VQFKVDDAERHGLAKMFAEPGEKNAVIEKQNALSPLATIGRADTNIVLQIASGPYGARMSLEDSTNLILHLQGSFGVDVLSQPRVTTKGTNEALLQISNARTIVLGGAKSSDTNALRTTNIWVGPSVAVQLLGQNERGLMIEAGARLDEFHGYLSENSDAPRPKFVVSTMGTRTQLQTNEVLLLGGPIQMNVVKTSERVAYLSDIPAIGRLFTETQVHTNFVRTLVIIRPTLKN
jgi:type II secretory pathway component GspD/PulD (secretin)